MKEKIKSKNNKELLDEVFDRLALLSNLPTKLDPRLLAIKLELEERLQSWERKEPRKLSLSK